MKINLAIGGVFIQFETDFKETILQLKQRIEKQLHLLISEQTIFFGGFLCEDLKTISLFTNVGGVIFDLQPDKPLSDEQSNAI